MRNSIDRVFKQPKKEKAAEYSWQDENNAGEELELPRIGSASTGNNVRDEVPWAKKLP